MERASIMDFKRLTIEFIGLSVPPDARLHYIHRNYQKRAAPAQFKNNMAPVDTITAQLSIWPIQKPPRCLWFLLSLAIIPWKHRGS